MSTNALHQICDNESKLARYAIDYAASPSPVAATAIRALIGRNLAIESDVLRPRAMELGIADVFVDSVDQLAEMQKALADGETSVDDVADELMTITSSRASYFGEVITPRFEEVLTPELLDRLALQIAPYGDDYHVHA